MINIILWCADPETCDNYYFINLAFLHWQILYQFLPIKRVIANDQRLTSLLSISCVFKNLCLPFYALHSFFLLPPTPFPQTLSTIKTFLNIQAVPGSAVFCNNAVLITTPSSFMQFLSFFDVLPSVPTTTGMIVVLLMFHILLISPFSSFLANSYFSSYRIINYGTTSLILIHYNNI